MVVDCQNAHLSGHDLFEGDAPLACHDTLVLPLHFANRSSGSEAFGSSLAISLGAIIALTVRRSASDALPSRADEAVART